MVRTIGQFNGRRSSGGGGGEGGGGGAKPIKSWNCSKQ